MTGSRTWTEAVVYNVEPAFLAAVDRLHSPIIHDIVDELYSASEMEQVVLPIELRMVEARVTAIVVGKEVVVETYISTSPDASVAVFSLVMD